MLPVFLFIIVFIVICIALLAVLAVMIRSLRQREQSRKKDELASELGLAPPVATKPQATRPKTQPRRPTKPRIEAEPEPMSLSDLMGGDDNDDYDPLAELYEMRASPVDEVDEFIEEDETDLAELLSGMADNVEVVHTIAEGQVSVQLDTGETASATELLSILRDEDDGRLMILAGDTAYRTLLNNQEVKQQFTTIMKELSTIILKPDTRQPKTDETDLAELLSGMAEDIHTVAERLVSVQLDTGDTTQATELLSILRDVEDGRLMILAGDTAYRTLMNNAEIKQQFTTIMKELSTIILKADTRQPKKAETTEPTKPATQSRKPTATASVASTPNDEVKESDDEAEEVVRLPGDLPDMTLPDHPDNYEKGRLGWVSVTKVDKAPELNIANAIESYLQYKIEQNPTYQRRGIHIKPALSGGVRIEADGKVYEFVDEIVDVDVRNFIQTAINEWQNRH